MADLYELVSPLPRASLLVNGLDNWIDAGFTAATARSTLVGAVQLELVARFDADRLVDHQARRPVLRIVDGLNTSLVWPVIELHEATWPDGQRFLYLAGAEPDHRWQQFSAAVVSLARSCEVDRVVALGGYPAPVPHTRPAKVVATATSRALADRVGYVPGTLDIPAGANAAIERACADAGLDAVSLWAQVPHYLANFPYPAAAIALLEALRSLTGRAPDLADLQRAAAESRHRIDELVATNPEHQQMVKQLESLYDDQTSQLTIPSGEELAAEVERFLRSQD